MRNGRDMDRPDLDGQHEPRADLTPFSLPKPVRIKRGIFPFSFSQGTLEDGSEQICPNLFDTLPNIMT
jgi:hypothetical protein